ncbi:NaeI family type II restriction endonuclease [Actinocorallia sp. B10E7]|uniref:NaeI family type II restriction endonuclease n=1 Tax=Actinocorallia sp. B10E7 TaxID=3153558 RepID=UPI00325D790F
MVTPESNDAELSIVEAHLKSIDFSGVRIAQVLRRTYDMLLDGQHTGRYRWDQLYKTEKTHFGTLVEINLQREFSFTDGQSMDFAIEGIDVDCKFSQVPGAWMIPPEANGHLLLGLWASDQQGLWAAGLVRADEAVLTSPRGNRDRKRQLTKAGKGSVRWLFKDMPLPENALLRIDPVSAGKILDPSLSGQQRVSMLFRLAQGRLISRNVVATVAQQDDYMKRVRGNGGARSKLRPEGIVILGQYSSHGDIARDLGLPVPGRGESLSVRLARRQSHHGDQPFITLDGQDWVIAGPADPPELAPLLPKV